MKEGIVQENLNKLLIFDNQKLKDIIADKKEQLSNAGST